MRKELETLEQSVVVIETVSDDILALDSQSLERVGGGSPWGDMVDGAKGG